MTTDKIILDAIKDLDEEKKQYFIDLFDKQRIQDKVVEAKAYLASTDFKVLPDYDKEPTEVIAKRAEAREFIRANQGVSNGL